MLAVMEPRVPLSPIWTTPALLVSGPVKVLAPVSFSTPLPSLASMPLPDIGAPLVSTIPASTSMAPPLITVL